MVPISHNATMQRHIDRQEERERLNPAASSQSRVGSLMSRLPLFSSRRTRTQSFDSSLVQNPPQIEVQTRTRTVSDGILLEFPHSKQTNFNDFLFGLGRRAADANASLCIPENLKDFVSDDHIKACLLQIAPHIEIIDLSDCVNLTGSFLETLNSCPNLKSINLSCVNKLQGNFLTNLRNCPLLEEANFLGNTAIRDKDLSFLEGTPEVTTLDLSSTLVNGSGLKYLKSCPRLQTLRLFSCRNLTGKSLRNLRFCPHLQNLDVWGCRPFGVMRRPTISKGLVEKLHKQYPNLSITASA